MWHRSLPDAPAWQGFEPDESAYLPAGTDACLLLDLLGRQGPLKVRPQGKGLRGYYQLAASDGGPDLFLKVVAPQRLASQRASDRLARWLAEQGCATLPLLSPEPISLPDGDLLFAQPLLTARYADTREQDMQALGRMLAALHGALARLPWREEIRQASLERDQAFSRGAVSALQLTGLVHRADEVRARIQAHPPALPAQRGQPLHGDLNLGNVLFPLDRPDQPVALDFEDGVHNWHSPTVDLAMALERFVLVRSREAARALHLGQALIGAYRSGGGRPDWCDGGLGDILRSLAVRALLLLAQLQAGGREVSPQEWDKFLFLFDQTREQADTLAALERS